MWDRTTPFPVVSAFEAKFKAAPLVVLTAVKFKRFPVPVVDEPVISTKLPVKPVVVPDWVTARALAEVWAVPLKAMFKPTPVVKRLLVKSTAVVVVLAVSKTIEPWL